MYFLFFNEDRFSFTVHPDHRFPYFNFSQLPFLFPSSTSATPFLLSLEKEAGLQDTTTNHEKIQETPRQGKFTLIKTAQGNPGGGKQVTRTDKMSETHELPLLEFHKTTKVTLIHIL